MKQMAARFWMVTVSLMGACSLSEGGNVYDTESVTNVTEDIDVDSPPVDDTDFVNSSSSEENSGGETDTNSSDEDGMADSPVGRPADGSPTVDLADPCISGKSLWAGDFLIEWDSALNAGQLRVKHRSHMERVLWQTVAGRGFVSTAHGKETVSDVSGFFEFKDKADSITIANTVTGLFQQGSAVRLEGELIRASEGVAFSLEFSQASDNRLAFVLRTHDPEVENRLYLAFAIENEEHLFGFGEQFTYLDIKGRRLPIWAQEQGLGRGAEPLTTLANSFLGGVGGNWSTTYTGVPQFVTNQGRGFFLENSEYIVFDATHATTVRVELFKGEMQGQIVRADDMLGAVEAFTEYSGRMKPLPDWAHKGCIVGMGGNTEEVYDMLGLLAEHDVPTTAFFLPRWVGMRWTPFGTRLWWNWESDPDYYPDWSGLVTDLYSKGIRVVSYINPFLSDVSEKENVRRHLYEEAVSLGYLALNSKGKPYAIGSGGFDGYMVDLSNPDAFDWLKQVVIDQLLGTGVSGWMGDFGEALPYDAQLANGIAASYHNIYPEDWVRLQQEAIEESGAQDVVFFSRSGNVRTPRYATMFWLGDQMISWDEHDGMKSSVTGMLSGGLSGYSLNHGDIGGYLSLRLGSFDLGFYRRSKELLLRWMELAAFTSMFRVAEGNSLGHQFYSDAETLEHLARCAKIFRALFDYRKVLMKEASERGYPLVRPMVLHYPDDPETYQMQRQFLLGADLLVAPVMEPEEDQVEVYLPKGRWIHLWTGEPFGDPSQGLWVTVSAPLGQPGLFYRADSTDASGIVDALRTEGILAEVD